MSFRQYALIVLLCVANCRAAGGQSALAPQSGVLVLRNGQVLEGDVIRAGDYYIVSRGEGSELRLKVDEVELHCGSMDEAYDFKVRHLAVASAKSHAELAKWCLRHSLFDKCSEQIAAALRLEPENPDLKDLETRLKLAVEKPPPSTPALAAPTTGVEDLEKALRDLPKSSVEKFGAIVQPILLNRCGAANQCHGPNSKSDFRLLKPPPGQIVSRRFTQRNLYASLRYLNATNPENSPLLMLPQQRHGNALSAVFDKHSANQLAELVAWVKLTVGPAHAAVGQAPATIPPTEATLSQPAASGGTRGAAATPPSELPGEQTAAPGSVRVMRPPLDDGNGSRPDRAQSQPQIRDRFDPEIFNRRYHGK